MGGGKLDKSQRDFRPLSLIIEYTILSVIAQTIECLNFVKMIVGSSLISLKKFISKCESLRYRGVVTRHRTVVRDITYVGFEINFSSQKT